MEKTHPIRVVVVDDSPNMRTGLRRLFESEPGIEVVGDAPDTAEAMKLVFQLTPDIVTTDLNRGPRDSGFDLLRGLKLVCEMPVKSIVLTADIEKLRIVEAFHLGARGVVLKSSATQTLLAAIRTVADAGCWIGTEPVSDLGQYMQTLVRELFPPGREA